MHLASKIYTGRAACTKPINGARRVGPLEADGSHRGAHWTRRLSARAVHVGGGKVRGHPPTHVIACTQLHVQSLYLATQFLELPSFEGGGTGGRASLLQSHPSCTPSLLNSLRHIERLSDCQTGRLPIFASRQVTVVWAIPTRKLLELARCPALATLCMWRKAVQRRITWHCLTA